MATYKIEKENISTGETTTSPPYSSEIKALKAARSLRKRLPKHWIVRIWNNATRKIIYER